MTIFRKGDKSPIDREVEHARELDDISSESTHDLRKAELAEKHKGGLFDLRLRRKQRIERQKLADTLLAAQVKGTRIKTQFDVEKSVEHRVLTLGQARRNARVMFGVPFLAFSGWSTVNVQDALVKLMGGATAPDALSAMAWGIEPGLAAIVGGVIYLDDKIANADGRNGVEKGLGKPAHRIKWGALAISLSLSLFAHWPERMSVASGSIMVMNAMGAIMAALTVWLLTLVTKAVRAADPELGATSLGDMGFSVRVEDVLPPSQPIEPSPVSQRTLPLVSAPVETEPVSSQPIEPSPVSQRTLPLVSAPVETEPVSSQSAETEPVSSQSAETPRRGAETRRHGRRETRAKAAPATALAVIEKPTVSGLAREAKVKAVVDTFKDLRKNGEPHTIDAVFAVVKSNGVEVSRPSVARYIKSYLESLED